MSTASQQRIPAALQNIFTASNQGYEVHEAPVTPNEIMVNQKYEGSTVYEASRKQYVPEHDKILKKKKNRLLAATIAEEGHEEQVTTSLKDAVDLTLQEYFDMKLAERGYECETYNTLQTGYYAHPTAHQKASYGSRMLFIVKSGNVNALKEVMEAGLSPNPCNSFGESLVHMACRRGNLDLLRVFVDAGACLQVSDDYGRTLLHDACWAANPAFDIVETLLGKDATMFFMKDKRGALPLSYVHKDDWKAWREWMDQNLGKYFPQNCCQSEYYYKPHELVFEEPNSWPVPDCKTDFSLELLQLIANGDMTPREAHVLAEQYTVAPTDDISTVVGTVAETEYTEDSYATDYDSDDHDADSESDWEGDEELLEIMNMSKIMSKSCH